jgi:hypothetical protein
MLETINKQVADGIWVIRPDFESQNSCQINTYYPHVTLVSEGKPPILVQVIDEQIGTWLN